MRFGIWFAVFALAVEATIFGNMSALLIGLFLAGVGIFLEMRNA